MRILAIETSCDETACAIVDDGWKVHANVIASSLDLHKKTGGVVPEVAARAHVQAIIPVIQEALSEAGLIDSTFDIHNSNIDAIAVTSEPGLQTSLLVGKETAKWLAYLWKKPLIPVNHIRGHVYANWLERNPEEDPIEFPVLCLSVSGGHNELILLRSHDDWEVLGESQDDAAGEAFDKVARILGLGYPGGPLIEKEAKIMIQMAPNLEGEDGLPRPLSFPRAWLNQNNSNKWDGTSYDFSFSGLKSEVLRQVQKRSEQGRLHAQDTALIAFAFQEAVFDVLVTKLLGAAEEYQVKEIHIAGGVSANKRLRGLIQERWRGVFRYPKQMSYCTDNAAMIGAAASFQTDY
jgi:N6-L-threonylcarbamoyladenine synthase